MKTTQSRTAVIHDFGGPDALQIETRAVGDPGAGEVRVRHAACGLNFIDVYQRTGLYKLPLPTALGLEAAGTIEAVGDGVTHLQEGMRVVVQKKNQGASNDHVIPGNNHIIFFVFRNNSLPWQRALCKGRLVS